MISAIMILIMVSGPFAILDIPMFDGNWSTLNHTGNPNTTPTIYEKLTGYVDIIGFENVSIINGTAYMQNGTLPVYLHSASDRAMRFNSYVDSLNSSATVTYTNDTVNVSICTTMEWHHTIARAGRKNKKYYFTSTAIFTDTAKMLDIYNSPEPKQINITQYTNATYPHSFIIIPELREDVTAFTVKYNNSSITKYVLYGVIEPNSKGLEQVNYSTSKIEQWKTEGDLCSHRAGMIVIDKAPLNKSLLNISFKHPYSSVECTEFIIQNITTEPDKMFKENGWPVAAILCIPIFIMLASLWMLRRLL